MLRSRPQAYVVEAKHENERRCATYGTRETSRWPKAGAQHLAMQHFFGSGSRVTKVKYHVGLSGAHLTTDSDVYNARHQRTWQHGNDTKIPAGALRQQLIGAEEAGDKKSRWMGSVSIFILGEFEVAKAASLDCAVLRMREEMQRGDAPAMIPKQESNIITGLFGDLVDFVADVYLQTFHAG